MHTKGEKDALRNEQEVRDEKANPCVSEIWDSSGYFQRVGLYI